MSVRQDQGEQSPVDYSQLYSKLEDSCRDFGYAAVMLYHHARELKNNLPEGQQRKDLSEAIAYYHEDVIRSLPPTKGNVTLWGAYLVDVLKRIKEEG